MKSLVFLLALSISLPVFAARSDHFVRLAEGGISLQDYTHKYLAPMLRRHIVTAGKASGLEVEVVEKILKIIAASNDLVPEGWVIDGVASSEEDSLVMELVEYDQLGWRYMDDDIEHMMGEMAEFLRDDKIKAFVDVYDDILVAAHNDEPYSPQEVAQELEIDLENAENLVQTTTMLIKQDRLFTKHMFGDIVASDLLASMRLLVNEYADLIDTSLHSELLDALALEIYPQGILTKIK